VRAELGAAKALGMRRVGSLFFFCPDSSDSAREFGAEKDNFESVAKAKRRTPTFLERLARANADSDTETTDTESGARSTVPTVIAGAKVAITASPSLGASAATAATASVINTTAATADDGAGNAGASSASSARDLRAVSHVLSRVLDGVELRSALDGIVNVPRAAGASHAPPPFWLIVEPAVVVRGRRRRGQGRRHAANGGACDATRRR